MIQSPFLQEVHHCRSVMKKLRKKIYKYNINKPNKSSRFQSTITDALTILQKRNLPQFLTEQLQKYSDMTFSSLSGFSLNKFRSVDQLTALTRNQQEQILEMYQNNKKTLKKRRNPLSALKMTKRKTSVGESIVSSTSISDIFDEYGNNESSICESSSGQSDDLFGRVNNSNSLDQDYHNNDAMFQSTMLDFGNQIEMDSEEFLFKY